MSGQYVVVMTFVEIYKPSTLMLMVIETMLPYHMPKRGDVRPYLSITIKSLLYDAPLQRRAITRKTSLLHSLQESPLVCSTPRLRYSLIWTCQN